MAAVIPDISDIADNVVADLNAWGFTKQFTARRFWRPRFKLTEMSTLHVSVAPRTIACEPITRGKYQNDLGVDVAVQIAFDHEPTEEDLDEYAGLTKEIYDFLLIKRPTLRKDSRTKPTAIAIDPLCDAQHLDELNQFTAVIRAVYQGHFEVAGRLPGNP